MTLEVQKGEGAHISYFVNFPQSQSVPLHHRHNLISLHICSLGTFDEPPSGGMKRGNVKSVKINC